MLQIWEMITNNLEVKIYPGAHSAANLMQRLEEMMKDGVSMHQRRLWSEIAVQI